MKIAKKWTKFLIGLAVLSFGLVLTIKSNLGVRPVLDNDVLLACLI